MSDEQTNNQALLEQARRLPEGIAPSRDLWPAISDQLGEQLANDQVAPDPAGATPGRSRSALVDGWQAPALAAGLLLAVVLGYWIGREDTVAPASPPLVGNTDPKNSALQPVSLVEAVGLLAARKSMAMEIEAGLDRLPEDARIVVIENLTAINKALDEIDAVLAQAPASGLDRQLLISMYTDQLARLSSMQALVMTSNQEILL